MQRVLIVGAGGHAVVAANVLLRAQEASADVMPLGFLDDNPALHGTSHLALPVFGDTSLITSIPHDALFVAIGDNRARARVFSSWKARGETFAIARHPGAIIAPDVLIGPGTLIGPGVVVNPGTSIGENVILNTGCTVDHHTRVEQHVHLAPGVHMGGDVVVGEGALVGIGAVILPQRHIGRWCVVGSGAVVHADVEDRTTVVGVPARFLKHIDKDE